MNTKGAVTEDPSLQRWVDGYNFWRSQYTVRNDNCKVLLDEFSKLSRSLRESCHYQEDFDDICSAIYLGIININNDNLKKIDINVLIDAHNKYKLLSQKYPYFKSEIYNSLEIIKMISSGSLFFYNDILNTRNMNRARAVTFASTLWHDKYPVVKIDCNADIEIIISEIRELYACENDLYVEGKAHIDEKRLHSELICKGVSYGRSGDESRALGLLLYDHIAEVGGSAAEAVRWAKNELREHGPKNFPGIDGRERQAHRWLANTRKCIEAAEVLEISDSDTKMRSLVSDTRRSKSKS